MLSDLGEPTRLVGRTAMRESWIRVQLCRECGCRRRWVVTNSPKYHYWRCSQGHKYSVKKITTELVTGIIQKEFLCFANDMMKPNPLLTWLKNAR